MSPPSGGQSSGSSGIQTIIMFGMIGVIFFFMIYRPQKKRQKERESLINQMEKGDKVITSSGIHGTIVQIDDTTVLVQVSDNTKLKFEKSAVNAVVNKKAEKVEKADKPEKADKLEKAA
jgi:preprotein translocase subunit YajC